MITHSIFFLTVPDDHTVYIEVINLKYLLHLEV